MTTPSQYGPGGAGPDERLQRAEHIIGALDKGIAVLGPDLTVRWANDAFRKWCPGDPIGKAFFEALTPRPTPAHPTTPFTLLSPVPPLASESARLTTSSWT